MSESLCDTPKYAASHKSRNGSYKIHSSLLRECLAEGFGTFILLVFGLGVVAQTTLSSGIAGGHIEVVLSWGLGVTFGIYFSGGVSGGHLNPAVTLALAVFHGFPFRKLPFYVISQIIGAFLGAALIYSLYYPALYAFDSSNPFNSVTSLIFAGAPQSFESTGAAFWTETVATVLLISGIFAVSDERNFAASKDMKPLIIGLLVVVIGSTVGYTTGYAMNPARDLGPRIFASLSGWGVEVFTRRDYYFWVPLVAPCVGAILGGGMYQLFIAVHHPKADPHEII